MSNNSSIIVIPSAIQDLAQIWGADGEYWHREEKILVGANTSQWTDKLGNGNHAVQATAADRPLWVDPLIDDDPGNDFDGITDNLEINNTFIPVFRDSFFKMIVCNFPDGRPPGSKFFYCGQRFVDALNNDSIQMVLLSTGAIFCRMQYSGLRASVQTAAGLLPNGQTGNLIINLGVINNFGVPGDMKLILRINGVEEASVVETLNTSLYGVLGAVNPTYGARNFNASPDLFSAINVADGFLAADYDVTKVANSELYASDRYNIAI